MTSATRRPLYFVNAAVDVLIIGGASVLTYIAFRVAGANAAAAGSARLAGLLVWVCNWPHFSATSHRLYRSRASITQYPVTALATPALMMLAVAAAFAWPAAVAPALVKLFLLWSPYHFSGQTVGVTLLYAGRAGFSLRVWERRALEAFVFGTFAVQTARAEVSAAGASFYGVWYPTWGLPSWLPTILAVVMVSCGVLFLASLAVRFVRERSRPPLIVFVPAIAQCIWFVAPPAGGFSSFVPFFHSLQYLLIAWAVYLKDSLDERARTPSRGFVLGASARWAVLNVLGGATLFWLLPRAGAAMGRSLPFAMGVMLAAVQIHHFFVDGVIWKLKNPRVRSPLSTSLAELSGRARPTDETPRTAADASSGRSIDVARSAS